MSGDRLAELTDVAGPVSRETLRRLATFESLFRKWAERINLAAPSTLGDLWKRHILDSAQLASLKRKELRWLDIGSGGGFPGMVLAILLMEREGGHIDLVESNRKKAAFLTSVVGTIGAPATVHARRIEDARTLVEQPEIMTARALAPLPSLLALSEPWLSRGATGLFHKGREYMSEVEDSRYSWRFDLLEHASRTDPSGVILEIGDLRRV